MRLRSVHPADYALAAVCAAAVLYAKYWYAPCDDAYIYLVYVRNLFEGNGLTYNGAQVLGFTSPLWIGIIMLAGFLTAELPLAVEIISMLFGVGVLVLVYGAARLTTASPPAALAATIAVASCGSFAFYMGNGLETVLFSGLMLWAASFLLRPDAGEVARSWSFPAALALLVFGRPEGVLFAAIFIASIAVWCRSLKAAAVVTLRTAALLLPFMLALTVYYGSPIPITYLAKSGAGLSNLDQGLSYTGRFLRWEGIPLIVALLALLRREPFGRARIPLALVLILWVAQVTVQGGDNMVAFRTFIPILPLSVLVAVRGWQHLIRTGGLSRQLIVLTLPLAISAYQLATFSWGTVVGSSWKLPVHKQAEAWRSSAEDRRWIGEMLRDRLPPKALIAVNAAGILPYHAARPTIDMLGLNDAYIARHGRRDRDLPYGHQAGDGAYVLRRRPAIIVFGGSGDPRAGDLVSEREIWTAEEFRSNYKAYLLENGRWIYARKNP